MKGLKVLGLFGILLVVPLLCLFLFSKNIKNLKIQDKKGSGRKILSWDFKL